MLHHVLNPALWLATLALAVAAWQWYDGRARSEALREENAARLAAAESRGRDVRFAAELSREAIAAVGTHLSQRAEPLRLAALHVMTGLMGSALLALAVDFGELDPEGAWSAAHVDEDFQSEQWGLDAEAAARRAARRRDMMAAATLLRALAPR